MLLGEQDVVHQVAKTMQDQDVNFLHACRGVVSDPDFHVAFPAGATPEIEDCSGCLQGAESCEAACQAIGFSSGVCGAPGSTDPSACCACQ